jgi:hypothetical protein
MPTIKVVVALGAFHIPHGCLASLSLCQLTGKMSGRAPLARVARPRMAEEAGPIDGWVGGARPICPGRLAPSPLAGD